MAVRWKCPSCETGRLAPERMAADDTRRFCLACSATSPRLVAMTSPTLEKRRAASRERSTAKAKAKRARAADAARARDTAAGVEVMPELYRLNQLKCVRRQRQRMGMDRRVPDITLHHGSGGHVSGHAYAGGSIHLTVGRGASSADVKESLAHELAHVILPDGVAHSEEFVAMLADIVREGYGVDVPLSAMHGPREGFDTAAYVWDMAARKAMKEAGL